MAGGREEHWWSSLAAATSVEEAAAFDSTGPSTLYTTQNDLFEFEEEERLAKIDKLSGTKEGSSNQDKVSTIIDKEWRGGKFDTRCNDLAVLEGRTLNGDLVQFPIRKRNFQTKVFKLQQESESDRIASPFYQLLQRVERNLHRGNFEKVSHANKLSVNKRHLEKELWVDKYRPRRFTDLVAVDGTSMEVLKWVTQWKKYLQGQNCTIKRNRSLNPTFVNDQIVRVAEAPEHKIMLLVGPPGLGKTTLAHVVAIAGGFDIVEVNASDDRTGDVVLAKIKAALQSDSIRGNGRPNLLVIDEIDGAAGTGQSDKSIISHLVKIASITTTNSSQDPGLQPAEENFKDGMDEKDFGRLSKKRQKVAKLTLMRPIICICNDMYVNALKPLRKVARIMVLRRPPATTIVGRLREICERERLKVEGKALLELADLMGGDMRASLHALQFISQSAGGQMVTGSKLAKSLTGFKDTYQSTGAIYDMLFHSDPREKKNDEAIIATIINSGEYERLIMGVFELYLQVKFYDDTCQSKLNMALDWLSWSDQLDCSRFDGSFSSYLPYTLFKLYRLFAAPVHPGFKFPHLDYDRHLQRTALEQIATEYQNGITPTLRTNDSSSLLLDRLPYVMDIITPHIRIANLQLLNQQERHHLNKIVSVMSFEGLTYRQVKRLDGHYDFILDPPVDLLVNLKNSPGLPLGGERSSTDQKCTNLTSHENAVRQIITQEIEAARIRFVQAKNSSSTEAKLYYPPEQSGFGRSAELQKAYAGLVPSGAVRLKKMATSIEKRDFFGRPLLLSTINLSNQMQPPPQVSSTHRVWFKFNEGYTNAIRRTIRLADLFPNSQND